MLKRQWHLQRRLVELSVDFELVPLLRAEIGALKGQLHIARNVLIYCDSKCTLVAELFKCAKSRRRQAATLQLQLDILRADSRTDDNCSEINSSILKAMLNEARDEQ